MAKNHTITIKDFEDFTHNFQLCGSFNQDENKHIDCNVNCVTGKMLFSVFEGKIRIGIDSNLKVAIDRYNQI